MDWLGNKMEVGSRAKGAVRTDKQHGPILNHAWAVAQGRRRAYGTALLAFGQESPAGGLNVWRAHNTTGWADHQSALLSRQSGSLAQSSLMHPHVVLLYSPPQAQRTIVFQFAESQRFAARSPKTMGPA